MSKCPYCPRTACVRAWDGEYVCQVCHKEMEDEFEAERSYEKLAAAREDNEPPKED